MQPLNAADLKLLRFTESNEMTGDTYQEDEVETYKFPMTDAYELTQEPSNDSQKSHWGKIWGLRGPNSGNLFLWQVQATFCNIPVPETLSGFPHML